MKAPAAGMAFVINNWDGIYENAQSRKVDRLLWVAVPNKHDSFGFRMLMDRPNGTALYGAWVLLVQVASRCEERGMLVKNGVVLTSTMISMLTHAPEALISDMLEAVQSKGIEWLSIREVVDYHTSPTQLVVDQVSETTQPGTRARAHSSFLPSILSASKESTEPPKCTVIPRSWEQDEQYARFVADYLGTGASLIPEDFAEAWQWSWKPLDFEQKLERIAALNKHAEEYRADPRFVPKPKKFLESEWKREPKPKRAAPERPMNAREIAKRAIQEGKHA